MLVAAESRHGCELRACDRWHFDMEPGESEFAATLNSFEVLSRREMAALHAVTTRQTDLSARTLIVADGDLPPTYRFVVSGWACRQHTSSSGHRTTLSYLLPGDLLDFNLYAAKPLGYSVLTLTRVSVEQIARPHLELLVAKHPGIMRAMWRFSAADAAMRRAQSTGLRQRSAAETIKHLLLLLYGRLEGRGLAQGGMCEFPLTQTDLAEATGLSVVHVSRVLQELRQRDAIEIRARTLYIGMEHNT